MKVWEWILSQHQRMNGLRLWSGGWGVGAWCEWGWYVSVSIQSDHQMCCFVNLTDGKLHVCFQYILLPKSILMSNVEVEYVQELWAHLHLINTTHLNPPHSLCSRSKGLGFRSQERAPPHPTSPFQSMFTPGVMERIWFPVVRPINETFQTVSQWLNH